MQQLDALDQHLHVPFRRKFFYGCGSFAEPFMVDIINAYILLYYNSVLQVDAKYVGWALFIPRFWDAITDPVMGQFSDNFRSRFGRRRPFMLFAGPLSCLLFFLLWAVPEGFDSEGKFYYLLGMSILFYTFMTIASIPYNALGAELSMDYNERTRIFAVRAFLVRVGSLLAAPFWWVIFSSGIFAAPRHGFLWIGFALATLAGIGYLATFWGTHELAEAQAQPKIKAILAIKHTLKNRQFILLMTTMFTVVFGCMASFPFVNYLSIYYVYGGDKAAAGEVMAGSLYILFVGVLICIPLVSRLSTRIGKRNGFVLCLATLIVGSIASWWLITPAYPRLQLLFWFIVIPANVGVTIFPAAMNADVIDIDELATGCRREGFY